MWDWYDPEPRWFKRFRTRFETLMTALDDELAAITASQADTAVQITAVAADVATLMATIAAFPPAGLTPAQQSALDAVAASATSIDAGVKAIDTTVNPPPPAPPAP